MWVAIVLKPTGGSGNFLHFSTCGTSLSMCQVVWSMVEFLPILNPIWRHSVRFGATTSGSIWMKAVSNYCLKKVVTIRPFSACTATVYRVPTGKQVNTGKNCFTYREYLCREQARDCFLFYGTGNDCWN